MTRSANAATVEEHPKTFDAPAHMRKIRTRQGMQDYLDVKWRVAWLRAEHPTAQIVTEQVAGQMAARSAAAEKSLDEKIARAIDSTGKYRSESAPSFFAISRCASSVNSPSRINGGANSSPMVDISMP